jgi:hypothetical protein
MNISSTDVMRRYLLGLADPESREALDARLFSDDQVFWERLTIAEDDLVDDYAAGELGAEESAAFASTFLCSEERRSKLAFAQAIRECARQGRPVRRGVWDWLRTPAAVPRWAAGVAASLVLMAAGLAWQINTGILPPAPLAVTVAPGLLRDAGAELARVRPSKGCQVVHLDLQAPAGPYTDYAATLHDQDGAPLWSQFSLAGTAREGMVVVRLAVPCDLLPEGDYWVRLSGVAPGQEPVTLDRYDLRVLRD